MLQRTAQARLQHLVGPYPVVFLTGPRQSGKTTLARTTFPRFRYLSLEDLQTREEASEDPRRFLSRFEGEKQGIILDEVQRVPNLFSYLQGVVDDERAGPFILTGSQHFLLSQHIGQSLAGRVGLLELLPLSLAEIMQKPARTPESLAQFQAAPAAAKEGLIETLWRGGFPRIIDRGLDPNTWLEAYVHTYIERDVRLLSNIGNLDRFTNFVRLAAGRTGQLINTASLGSDAGVSHTTVVQWLSILRASYITEPLIPHYQNFNKRLVKSSKLYFVDTGLLCFLLGIRRPEDLMIHPLRGAVFENFVHTELRKIFHNVGQRPPVYFWRDSNGREVDFLIEYGGKYIPIEAKSGQTVADDFFRDLDFYCKLAGCPQGILIYGGQDSYRRKSHHLWSWSSIS